MRNIQEIKQKALDIICAAGIEAPAHVSNTIFKYRCTPKAYGMATHHRRGSKEWTQIVIDPVFSHDSIPEIAGVTIMVHELVHIIANHVGHDGRWKELMRQIAAYDPRFGITAPNPSTYFTADCLALAGYKYADQCPVCGSIYYLKSSPRKDSLPSFCSDCQERGVVILGTRKTPA